MPQLLCKWAVKFLDQWREYLSSFAASHVCYFVRLMLLTLQLSFVLCQLSHLLWSRKLRWAMDRAVVLDWVICLRVLMVLLKSIKLTKTYHSSMINNQEWLFQITDNGQNRGSKLVERLLMITNPVNWGWGY